MLFQYFDTIENAFNFSEELESPLIFIHAGVYKGEFIIVDTNISLIGAGMFNDFSYFIITI